MRVCRTCGVTLTPLINICKSRWDKKQNWCKKCACTYNKEHAKRKREEANQDRKEICEVFLQLPQPPRICQKCGSVLILGDNIRQSAWELHDNICRTCTCEKERIYRVRSAEKLRERKRRYYIDNQEKVRTQKKAWEKIWRESNPEKARARDDQINKWKRERRKSDEEYRAKYNENKRVYYHTHKQDILAANKKLRLKDPDKFRAYRATTRANKRAKQVSTYIAYRKSREVYHLFQFLEGVAA